jgi:hypothetical protein
MITTKFENILFLQKEAQINSDYNDLKKKKEKEG